MYIETHPKFSEHTKASEISFRSGGYVITDETWVQEPLYAPYTRLYYVMSGGGVLYSEHEEMHLEPGYVYLAPSGMKYGFYGTPAVEKLYFHINVVLSREGYDAFASSDRFVRFPRNSEALARLKKQYFSESPYDHLLLKNEIHQTVCDALRELQAERGMNHSYSEATVFAMGYVSRNLSAHLTVREVAEGCFCSQSKLSALFRCEVGQSIANYIDDLLMAEAKHRLIYSKDSIMEISDQLGFCDQFYFSRKFSKKFGVSPLQFRKKQQGDMVQDV